MAKKKRQNVAQKAKKVEEEPEVFSERSCTGVLTSRSDARDIKIESFSLTFHGRELITDTTIELNHGQRYGLIGFNGTGKSTFLKALAAREVPIPELIDIHHLSEEALPSERTAIEAVIDEAEKEVHRLEKEEEEITTNEGPESDKLHEIYDRLEELDPSTFEKRAGELLCGLGFSLDMMNKKTKDMSGGWRMRVSLAKALFVKPLLLLLDEPTNHLDLAACVWLEEYLKNYKHTLVIVSHSQDFLNGVCSNIIHLYKTKLIYYGGNYDTYLKTRKELEQNQMKQYQKQQNEIAHIKTFIASCGTYANLVRQAKSRQKILDKMEASGLVERVTEDSVATFQFFTCDRLPPPVIQFCDLSFSYSGDRSKLLYHKINFGVDMDSRIALVGPNGAGKSTLLKLMCGLLPPLEGEIKLHCKLQIARYHQHAQDQLDLAATPIEFVKRQFPDKFDSVHEETIRACIGRYGLTGSVQTLPIGLLSGGQKARIIFALLALQYPNIILFDEPTNHLDMESIDALASAINAFEGGIVLVSHDFRLIEQVAKEIWVCEKKKVTKWNGDIRSYKEHLKRQMNL